MLNNIFIPRQKTKTKIMAMVFDDHMFDVLGAI